MVWVTVWLGSVATPTEVAVRVGDPRGYKSRGALCPVAGIGAVSDLLGGERKRQLNLLSGPRFSRFRAQPLTEQRCF